MNRKSLFGERLFDFLTAFLNDARNEQDAVFMHELRYYRRKAKNDVGNDVCADDIVCSRYLFGEIAAQQGDLAADTV